MGFIEMGYVFNKVHCLTPAQKMLTLALADRANDEGKCWPNVDELSFRCDQSRRTIFRHFEYLQSIGILSIRTRRKQDSDGRWVQSSSVYTLDLQGMVAGRYAGKILPPLSSQLVTSASGSVADAAGTSVGGVGMATNTDKQNGRSEPGCQVDTLKTTDEQNGRSEPGCQVDTLKVSGCQNQPFQGDTGVTHNYQPELPTLSPPTSPQVGGGDVSGSETAGAVSLGADSAESVGQDFLENQLLLAEALPDHLLAIPASAVAMVAEHVRARLDAGWTTEQLRQVLSAKLPGEVQNIAAVVVWRLGNWARLDAAPKTLEHARRVQRQQLEDSARQQRREQAKKLEAERLRRAQCSQCDDRGWVLGTGTKPITQRVRCTHRVLA